VTFGLVADDGGESWAIPSRCRGSRSPNLRSTRPATSGSRARAPEGLKTLGERGAEEVFLEVRASNSPAIELYRASGFRPVGVRSDYYRNPREDALVLRLGFTGLA
jgi:hypothetical protein